VYDFRRKLTTFLASLQCLLREASLTDASGNTTLLYQNKVVFGQCLLPAMGGMVYDSNPLEVIAYKEVAHGNYTGHPQRCLCQTHPALA
jgi:hypothetical protein